MTVTTPMAEHSSHRSPESSHKHSPLPNILSEDPLQPTLPNIFSIHYLDHLRLINLIERSTRQNFPHFADIL